MILPAFLASHLPNDSKGGNNVAEPSGDTAAEQEAAAKLRGFKDDKEKSIYLVISEPPDKRVTSINFCGKPVGDDALALVPKLYRVMTVNAGDCQITSDQLKYFSGLSILNNLILNDTPDHRRGTGPSSSAQQSRDALPERHADLRSRSGRRRQPKQIEDIGPFQNQSHRRGTEKAAAAGRTELASAVGNRDHQRRRGQIWRA